MFRGQEHVGFAHAGHSGQAAVGLGIGFVGLRLQCEGLVPVDLAAQDFPRVAGVFVSRDREEEQAAGVEQLAANIVAGGLIIAGVGFLRVAVIVTGGGGGEAVFVAAGVLVGETGEVGVDALMLAIAREIERGVPGVGKAAAALGGAQLLGAECVAADGARSLLGRAGDGEPCDEAR